MAQKIPASQVQWPTGAKTLLPGTEEPPIRYTEPTPQPTVKTPLPPPPDGGTTQPVPPPKNPTDPASIKTPSVTAPTATGNPQADILGYLRATYPSARPADLIAALPTLQAMYPGLQLIGDDKIRLPDGRVIDVGLSFGAGGGVGWWWGDDSGGGAAPPQGASPFGTPMAPASLGGASQAISYQPTTAGTLARQPTPAANDIQSAFQSALMEMLQRRPGVSAESLRTGPQFQAYQMGSQRASERDLADAAERAAYEGYSDSGAAETERAGIRQQRGEGEAAFLGNLAVTEMAAQRQELQFALQTAAALGDAEATRELQRELADLDAAIQRERIGFSYDQANLQAALDREHTGFNYDQLQALLNERAANAALEPF